MMTDWQPIATAPRDGTHILIYEPCEDTPIYVCKWVEPAYYSSRKTGGWQEAGGEEYFRWKPTHWMPLPEPPHV